MSAEWLLEQNLVVRPALGDKYPGVTASAEGLTAAQVASRRTVGDPERYNVIIGSTETGLRSGVIDVETDVNKETGEMVGEQSLRDAGIALPPGPWMQTPSGSRHRLFRLDVPEGMAAPTSRPLLPKVDVPWQFLAVDEGRVWHDTHLPIPDAPPELAALLVRPKRARIAAPTDTYEGEGAGSAEAVAWVEKMIGRYKDLPWSGGGWNDAFHKAVFTAYGLVAAGRLEDSWAEQALLGACQDPAEALPVFESSKRAGLANPIRPRVEGQASPATEPVALGSADWIELLDEEQQAALEAQIRQDILEGGGWSVEDILTRKPPAWLIRGFLQESATAQLVGPFAGGKSLLTLHWCAELVRQGKYVLYCASEGLNGFGGRLRALMAEQSIDHVDLSGITFYKDDIDLTSDESADRLARYCAQTGPWDLVVVDTLARAIAGAEENAAGEMSAAIKRAERAKHGTTTILLVHHAGWSGARGRGSTAIPSAQDNIVHCFPAGEAYDGKDGKPLVIKVTSEKLKDGSASRPQWFRAQERTLGTLDDGSPWTSVALVETDEPTGAGAVDLATILGNGAVLSSTEIRDGLGWSKSSAALKLEALVTQGEIVQVDPSRGNRPATYKLASTEQ